MNGSFARVLACAGASLLGCSSAPDAPGDVEPRAGSMDMVHRTVVKLRQGGAQSVETVLVPRARAEAEAAARSASLAARGGADTVRDDAAPASALPEPDPTCAPSDIWIYDASGSTCPPTGFVNEICFSFSPDATNGARDAVYPLASYPRCVGGYRCWRSWCGCARMGTWENAVGAYWPGVSRGFFEGRIPVGPYVVFADFDAWGACTTQETQPGGTWSVEALQYATFVALVPPGE